METMVGLVRLALWMQACFVGGVAACAVYAYWNHDLRWKVCLMASSYLLLLGLTAESIANLHPLFDWRTPVKLVAYSFGNAALLLLIPLVLKRMTESYTEIRLTSLESKSVSVEKLERLVADNTAITLETKNSAEAAFTEANDVNKKIARLTKEHNELADAVATPDTTALAEAIAPKLADAMSKSTCP